MKFPTWLVVFLFVSAETYPTETSCLSGLRILTPQESSKIFSTGDKQFETKLQEQSAKSGALPPDNGGNYGDLVYRGREEGDVLVFREVVINQELESQVKDLRLYASLAVRRITSVRVLNLGRERGYTLRIDVVGNEFQTIVRIAPYFDPRLLIEVYGF